MRVRFAILSLAILLGRLAHAAESEKQAKPAGATARVLFPSLTAEDATGQRILLLSLEAYRAEFRYLKRIFLETDLKAPAVVTDGWTTNIAEAEWPFMAFAYFGYACANLAR